jgi:histidine triad (HIT) family protein
MPIKTMEQECIFCKMVSKQITVAIVYEDDSAFAFLDINPIAKGHTLVITKKHYENLLAVEQNDLKGLAEAIQKISVAVVKATGAEGFNVLQNNGEVAGQLIPHVHFHIIPRFKDDQIPIGGPMQRGKYEGDEIQEIMEKIRSEIPEAKSEEVKEEKVEEEKPVEHTEEEAYWIRRELELG